VFVVLPCIGFMAKTCSMLIAIAELNLDVICQYSLPLPRINLFIPFFVDNVLEETEDTAVILEELRERILAKIIMLEKVGNVDRKEVF
jgi:hypothetical protein